LTEDGPDALVPLHVNAADLARAIIEVEIDRKLVELGLRRRYGRILVARAIAIAISGASSRGRGGGGRRSEHIVGWRLAEMFFDKRPRAQQALFLAAPESDANCSPRLQVQGLEDANGFHGDRDASPIVGGACAAVPRVHVSSQHDDLLFQV